MVNEHDLAIRIEDDETFLQGFENVLQETFFLDESGDDMLDLARLDPVDSSHELF